LNLANRSALLLSTAIIAAAISQASAHSSPSDYFVSAIAQAPLNGLPDLGGLEYVIPIPGVSTGQIAGPAAEIVNPVTTSSHNGLQSEGNAKAAADLTTGKLHASGGPTSDPFAIGFAAFGNAAFGDVLHFTNSAADSTTVTEIGFKIHVAGILGNFPGFPNICCTTSGNSQATLIYGVGNYLTSGGVFGDFNPSTSNIVDTDFSFKNWYRSNFVDFTYPDDYPIDEDIIGEFSFLGSSADAAVYMFLQAGGQYQYSNFGDTATFSFDDLPAGVSYSSDSGHFLTSAPEPSTWALMMIGFSGIIFWRSVESKARGRRLSAICGGFFFTSTDLWGKGGSKPMSTGMREAAYLQ
jgi:PEP-CTERM motif